LIDRCLYIDVSLQLLNVPLDQLVCHVTEQCPSNCSCVKRPYNRSFEITCPPSTLHSLPHRLPDPDQPPPRKGRFDLRFGGSEMKYLESRDYFVDTYRLDVSNSQIKTVTDDAWRSLQTTDQVDLSGNLLTTLPRLLQVENVTFRWIDLHGNPLSCECEQRWLASWLKLLGTSLHHHQSVLCHSPEWLKQRSIRTLNASDYCRNPDQERVYFALKVRRQLCCFSILTENRDVTVISVQMISRCGSSIQATIPLCLPRIDPGFSGPGGSNPTTHHFGPDSHPASSCPQ